MKDLRHYFEKVSGEMDSVLQRSSGVSRSRAAHDVDDMKNLVIATRRAFRHTSIDYVHAISIAQGKKRHEVVDAVSMDVLYLLFYPLNYGCIWCSSYEQKFVLLNSRFAYKIIGKEIE